MEIAFDKASSFSLIIFLTICVSVSYSVSAYLNQMYISSLFEVTNLNLSILHSFALIYLILYYYNDLNLFYLFVCNAAMVSTMQFCYIEINI